MVKRLQHRFVVRLRNHGGRIGRDAQHVLMSARRAAGQLPIFLGVARVSRDALEFDVHAASPEVVERWAQEASELGELLEIRSLDPTRPPEPKEQAIVRGCDFFNAERFWEAHEVWEGAWKQARGTERDALQALILIAAAFVHQQRGRNSIGLGILRRAERLLSRSDGQIGSIDLAAVARKVGSMLSDGVLIPFRL